MKNVHLLPTDKPSRLYLVKDKLKLSPLKFTNDKEIGWLTQHIYITSDEEIKANEWFYSPNTNSPQVYGHNDIPKDRGFKKIILTTDVDLIKDGVQAIDDEFLEWFVKNPSCEYIKTEKWLDDECGVLYSRTIPKEEPKQEILEDISLKYHQTAYENLIKELTKQETLEEVRKVERTELFNSILSIVKQIPRKDIDGDAMDAISCAYEIEQLFYKWQQEQDKKMFSEEDLFKILLDFVAFPHHDMEPRGSIIERYLNELSKKKLNK